MKNTKSGVRITIPSCLRLPQYIDLFHLVFVMRVLLEKSPSTEDGSKDPRFSPPLKVGESYVNSARWTYISVISTLIPQAPVAWSRMV